MYILMIHSRVPLTSWTVRMLQLVGWVSAQPSTHDLTCDVLRRLVGLALPNGPPQNDATLGAKQRVPGWALLEEVCQRHMAEHPEKRIKTEAASSKKGLACDLCGRTPEAVGLKANIETTLSL